MSHLTPAEEESLRGEFKKEFDVHIGTGNPVLVRKQRGTTGYTCTTDTLFDYWIEKINTLLEQREKREDAPAE